jgi:SPP1 family predicted phage head-tail adaptor
MGNLTMQAGPLRHRITFQSRQSGVNSIGEPVGVWTDVKSRWAQKTNRLSAAAEAIASGMKDAHSVVQFDLRPTDVDHTWRIVWKGIVYDIKDTLITNENDRISILAVANVDPAVGE